jgi:hypothetical protein
MALVGQDDHPRGLQPSVLSEVLAKMCTIPNVVAL